MVSLLEGRENFTENKASDKKEMIPDVGRTPGSYSAGRFIRGGLRDVSGAFEKQLSSA